ncbi:hypothetical protein Fcan01_26360 [Folsomia candida]|uniref:Uncharacterized protein n=1 Tax=Folsomia candida TaxID=158441 RepID=A0A226D0V5_FOLCA|nr:hypothetical protein Fcan01_26360 [Folsomia candida]
MQGFAFFAAYLTASIVRWDFNLELGQRQIFNTFLNYEDAIMTVKRMKVNRSSQTFRHPGEEGGHAVRSLLRNWVPHSSNAGFRLIAGNAVHSIVFSMGFGLARTGPKSDGSVPDWAIRQSGPKVSVRSSVRFRISFSRTAGFRDMFFGPPGLTGPVLVRSRSGSGPRENFSVRFRIDRFGPRSGFGSGLIRTNPDH